MWPKRLQPKRPTVHLFLYAERLFSNKRFFVFQTTLIDFLPYGYLKLKIYRILFDYNRISSLFKLTKRIKNFFLLKSSIFAIFF